VDLDGVMQEIEDARFEEEARILRLNALLSDRGIRTR